MSDRNSNGNGKNPWGSSGNNGSGNWNKGGGNHGGGGDPAPDIEEIFKGIDNALKGLFPGGGDKNIFKLVFFGLIIVLGLWLSSGFYVIKPGENGVVQRFGKWERTRTDEGLDYRLPYPIDTVKIINVSEIKRMEVGFRTGYDRRGMEGKRDVPDESLMLTADANIVDLDMVVLWNIASAEDYIFNIDDPENTIRKVAESAIREVVGQTAMFPIITQERTSVAQRAKEIMMKNLDQYKAGVNISQVLIQQAEVHPDVQAAFQDVQSARQDAIDVQNRAKAYREDIIPKARGEAIKLVQEATGYKEAVIAQAKGDADRFVATYEAYLTGKEVTRERMYLETMEDIFKNASKVIMDNDGGAVPYLPLNEALQRKK